MLDAISSAIYKTVDIYLKINSSERRRRKFAKQLFEVYKSLDDVVYAIDKIQLTVKEIGQRGKKEVTFELCESDYGSIINKSYTTLLPDYIRIKWKSSTGDLAYETMFLDEHGSERISPTREINQRDLLPVVLSSEIRMLNKAFVKIISIMEAESWELWHARSKPEKLKALSVYDTKLVDTFIHAWFADGGFVGRLYHMGIHQEFDSRILRLRDAKFEIPPTVYFDEVVPEETTYDLTKSDQIEAFLSYSQTCKVAVEEARDKVKEFISKNCTIEDIL